MHILIFIASRQKGFFISLARMLAKEHKVLIVARDRLVADLVRRQAPELVEALDVAETFSVEIPESQAVACALDAEQRYGVRMSFLLSHDRALGRGYIFNADSYPQIGRAFWSHERKLVSVLKRAAYAEYLLQRFQPDVLIAIQKDEIMNVVAQAHELLYLSPAAIKLGNRFMWSDNEFMTSNFFLESIRANLAKRLDGLSLTDTYSQDAGSKFNHAKLRYTWTRGVKESIRQVIKEVKTLVRQRRKKDSYPFLGWIPYLFRRPYIYRYFLNYGKRSADLAGRRTVYIPLHLEPEIALLAISPEFNNSMEMIAWISKAAPADVLLVVKEQPYSFGVRSRRFYEQLRQIPNVVLAHPETTSWEWIKATTITATLTGTAATEAVTFGRPVLSFGRHQAVNLLPTVRLATDFESVCDGLNQLLALDQNDPVFELSRRAFYHAQLASSFELPEFERTHASVDLQDVLAEIALANLKGRFPSFMTSKRNNER